MERVEHFDVVSRSILSEKLNPLEAESDGGTSVQENLTESAPAVRRRAYPVARLAPTPAGRAHA